MPGLGVPGPACRDVMPDTGGWGSREHAFVRHHAPKNDVWSQMTTFGLHETQCTVSLGVALGEDLPFSASRTTECSDSTCL